MTGSRDNSTICTYPGEMRAGELVAIREAVAKYIDSASGSFLLVGDFNSAPDSGVFTGRIGAAKAVETGFNQSSGAFEWRDASNSELLLHDAFAEVHQRGAAVAKEVGDASSSSGKYCTSRNADRVDWIDYILAHAARACGRYNAARPMCPTSRYRAQTIRATICRSRRRLS